MTEPHRPADTTGGTGKQPHDAEDDVVDTDQLTDQFLGEVEDHIVELVAAKIDSDEARIGTSMAWLLRGGPSVATSAIGYLLQIVESLVNMVGATHHRPPAQVWVEFAKRWNPPGSPEPAYPETAPPTGTVHHGPAANGAGAGAAAMVEVFRNDHGVLVRWDGAAGFAAILDTGDADGRLIERFHAAGPVTREQAEAEASQWWARQLGQSQDDDDRVAAYDLAYKAVEEYLRDNKNEYLRLLDTIMDDHAYTCWAVIALMGTTANVVREVGRFDADGWVRMAEFLRMHDQSWSSADIIRQSAVRETE